MPRQYLPEQYVVLRIRKKEVDEYDTLQKGEFRPHEASQENWNWDIAEVPIPKTCKNGDDFLNLIVATFPLKLSVDSIKHCSIYWVKHDPDGTIYFKWTVNTNVDRMFSKSAEYAIII